MPQTTIVECPNCKGLMLATAAQKTKSCPFCGSRLDLTKAKRLARAATPVEASKILRKLKTDRQRNPKIDPKK